MWHLATRPGICMCVLSVSPSPPRVHYDSFSLHQLQPRISSPKTCSPSYPCLSVPRYPPNPPAMAPRDRTSEFHSTLSSIKSRTALPTGGQKRDEAKQRLISHDAAGGPSGAGAGAGGSGAGSGKKSEFGRMAGGIAKDINSTTLKLQKLAQCEWRRGDQSWVWVSSRCWCDSAWKGGEEGAIRCVFCEKEWRGGRAFRDRPSMGVMGESCGMGWSCRRSSTRPLPSRGDQLSLEPELDDEGRTPHVLPEGVTRATAAARRLEHCRRSLLRDVPGVIPSRSLLSSSAISRNVPVLLSVSRFSSSRHLCPALSPPLPPRQLH
jgi:hypothetical protein